MRLAVVLGGLGCVIGLAGSGCSPRNLHRELEPDVGILVRQGVFPTRVDEPLAGVRGTEYSAPVLWDKTLIFGTQETGLVALYPGLGQTRWVLPIPKGVRSEIAVHEDRAYVVGGDGFLYCVDLRTGHVVWPPYNLRVPGGSRPVVAGGRVFVTSFDDTVYALDAGTGKWLWHYRRRAAGGATVLGASAPLVDGDLVYAGLSDGFLVALTLADGQLRWERKLHYGSRFTDVDASPVLTDGVIYSPSYDGSLYALKREGGTTLWKFDAGGSRDLVIEGDRLYFASSDGFVYAISRETGREIWKFELDFGVPTKVAVADDLLVFGSSGRYLYAVQKADGKGVYRYDIGYESGFSSAPLYDAKTRRLFILSGGGNLYTFAVRPPGARPRPYAFAEPWGLGERRLAR